MELTAETYKKIISQVKTLLSKKKEIFKDVRLKLEQKKIENLKNEIYGK